MFEPAQIIGVAAAILLLASVGLWLRPSTLQQARTSKRAAPPSRELSQSAGVMLLIAVGASAVAAIMAVIGLVMG